MRPIPLLACVSLVALLTACNDSNTGFYDANGRYVPYSTQTPEPFEHNVTLRERTAHEARNYAFNRRGYYDYYGYYIARAPEGMAVPAHMFPPRGMCRIWFPDRDVAEQPAVEGCRAINARVPAGAYVIYGG